MMYICMLVPAFISLGLVAKEKDSVFKKIAIYAQYCLLINICSLVIFIIIGKGFEVFDVVHTTIYYIIYLVCGFTFAYVLPKVIAYIKDNFKVNAKRKRR